MENAIQEIQRLDFLDKLKKYISKMSEGKSIYSSVIDRLNYLQKDTEDEFTLPEIPQCDPSHKTVRYIVVPNSVSLECLVFQYRPLLNENSFEINISTFKRGEVPTTIFTKVVSSVTGSFAIFLDLHALGYRLDRRLFRLTDDGPVGILRKMGESKDIQEVATMVNEKLGRPMQS